VPEYLAPGVFVEETSFRAKSIEGVSTSTTGFVGPTRRGPVATLAADGATPTTMPEILTSFADFQRIYGGLEDLTFTGGTAQPNYVAHAARAYFDNGGARLFVARVFGGTGGAAQSEELLTGVRFVARTSGRGGDGKIQVFTRFEPTTRARALNTAAVGTIVRVGRTGTPEFFLKGTGATPFGAAFPADADTRGIDVVTLSLVTIDGDGTQKIYDGVGLDENHPRYIGRVLARTPTRRLDQLEQTYAIALPATLPANFALDFLDEIITRQTLGIEDKYAEIAVTGGSDGTEPASAQYKDALKVLAAVEDIAIVAAPASGASAANRQAIHDELIIHVEARRAYRIAVLDTARVSTAMEARDDRARLDSSRAAIYTPWVIVPNPLFRPGEEGRPREIALPPSGFVSGIYARNDVQRGVFKAPANEIVRGALRHDIEINFAQQEVLNPNGVNCLRFFPNRGNRVWGARTISSDPEWKYVNVRRYFNYLERSIDIGTQWAVFEPNGERLWANVRETVSSFLVNEWRSGALLGTSTKEAFFVRCDRSTMDQNDLDNGRLICLVGVAVVKPAEFVIFRVGQKTADMRS
jgi:phage tail sheath protein FI